MYILITQASHMEIVANAAVCLALQVSTLAAALCAAAVNGSLSSTQRAIEQVTQAELRVSCSMTQCT